MTPSIKLKPLTDRTWGDFESLFGSNGACGGCWCMWWRVKRSLYVKNRGAGNKRSIRKIVRSGGIPGVIAYYGGEPVGWCSIGPREEYPVLEGSRNLARVDVEKVWSIVCFFVRKDFRRKGFHSLILRAVVGYARKKKVRIIEAYPIDSKKTTAAAFLYTGILAPFEDAGFVEVARRARTRPVVRYFLK